MDTTTRVPACSPSLISHVHAVQHQPVTQSPVIHTGLDIPAEPQPKAYGKGRRIALIAGIVMGHLVTIFGPLLLGRWPVAPL